MFDEPVEVVVRMISSSLRSAEMSITSCIAQHLESQEDVLAVVLEIKQVIISSFFFRTLPSVMGMQMPCRYPDKCHGFAEIDLLSLWLSVSQAESLEVILPAPSPHIECDSMGGLPLFNGGIWNRLERYERQSRWPNWESNLSPNTLYTAAFLAPNHNY